MIDAFHPTLSWPSGVAPALFVRTIRDGYHYAFWPAEILSVLGKKARGFAEKELDILQLRAQVEIDGFTAAIDEPPPDIPSSPFAPLGSWQCVSCDCEQNKNCGEIAVQIINRVHVVYFASTGANTPVTAELGELVT